MKRLLSIALAVSGLSCGEDPAGPGPRPSDSDLPPLASSIAAGRSHACLGVDGEVLCWGSDEFYQLADSATGACTLESGPIPCSTAPAPIPGEVRLTGLVAGERHTCGLTAQGQAFCWGSNDFGQLGDGTTTLRTTPTPVWGGIRFVALAAGTYHTCGITGAGDARCWGAARSGAPPDSAANALGAPVSELCRNPTPTYRGAEWPCSPKPVAMGGDLSFRSIGSGIWSTCGVTDGGVAHCWGWNSIWGLGTGDEEDRATPTRVSTSLRFSQVAAGTSHACAVTGDGDAHCWGARAFNWGQLGDGEVQVEGSPTPVPVQGGHQWSSLHLPVGNSILSGFTCGVTTSGAVHCWGSNRDGQLGSEGAGEVCDLDREFPCTGTPLPVAVPEAREVAAGTGFACSLGTDDTVHCWGLNDRGQLGDGTTTSRAEPRPVSLP